MKKLFTIFEVANSSVSEVLQKRSVLACDIIAQMLLSNSKGKSWFWKFRHILYKLEEYFLTSNVQRAHLERIFCHYLYFHDFYHAEQLASKFGVSTWPRVQS